LAKDYKLTAYDTVYLESGLRKQAVLGTLYKIFLRFSQYRAKVRLMTDTEIIQKKYKKEGVSALLHSPLEPWMGSLFVLTMTVQCLTIDK
jgi:hypothetical protein